MSRVAVAGLGSTRFSREAIPIECELAKAATDMFRGTKNLAGGDVDAVLVSTNDDAKYLSAILSEMAGMTPRIAHTVESLCSSGTSAIVSGMAYIESGLADVVLVAGADRFDGPGQVLKWDKSRGGFAHPTFWASIFTRAYKSEFGVRAEELAAIPVKNHRNAKDNPHAYRGGTPTIQDVLESRKVTDELGIYDCSRPCTGACAVLLASEDVAVRFTDSPVWITGSGQKTIGAGFAKNPSLTRMESTVLAARSALAASGKKPGDVDVVELHDAFSVFEALALEDLGLVPKGKGARRAAELLETGDRFSNPRGGIIGSGHPLGATGLAQTAEVTRQLRGEAGKRQVQGAKTGMVHNMSAAATSSTVLVMES